MISNESFKTKFENEYGGYKADSKITTKSVKKGDKGPKLTNLQLM